MSLKPIKLYWRSESPSFVLAFGPKNSFSLLLDQVPNPSKVLVILEELGLPYKTEFVELEGLKHKPFTDINPNGKVPGRPPSPSPVLASR